MTLIAKFIAHILRHHCSASLECIKTPTTVQFCTFDCGEFLWNLFSAFPERKSKMKSIISAVFILSVLSLPAQSAFFGLVKDLATHTTNTSEVVATDVVEGKNFEIRFFFAETERFL